MNESILSIITHFTREVKGFILANGSTTQSSTTFNTRTHNMSLQSVGATA